MSNRLMMKPVTTFSLLLGMGLMAPMTLFAASTSAQLLPEDRQERTQEPNRFPREQNGQRELTIPAGTTIPTSREDAEKIMVLPDETTPVTLQVAANVKNRQGTVLIPFGSKIKGEIQPHKNGSRFVAEELIVEGEQPQSIDATSQVVTRRETVERGADTGDILEGALIGAGAAAVLSGVLGDDFFDFKRILGGAGAGALGGLILGKNEAEVISIDPNKDLDVTLNSQLSLSR